MLQLKNIRKSYTTGDFTQVALDNVSINFRDNEFAAILGPSGSGKTTLLNIIGGLDHYDSGDLIIDGISTKNYKDRDWDTFRNNRIGFVFQSYNLIPHQTVLANVELALTLSGVGREERRNRAIDALKRVGLGDHVHKKPSQLSGGQMQRVAIARALINDPEILLADEPTGALDSKTSIQIMDLLTEIANDRLVIMVTHNPELADTYATRIVNLADGHILADTDPYAPTTDELASLAAKKPRRTSMSFLTALSLSFNNLMTKKGRTIMTAFAGSIGIIGIAAILALANGVNNYITSVEEETLSSYPLQITSTGFDMTSMMVSSMGMVNEETNEDSKSTNGDDTVVHEANVMNRMFESVGSNDLASLKEFLDSGESNIYEFANDVEYKYNVTPQIYLADTENGVQQVNPDTTFSSMGMGSSMYTNNMMSTMMSTDMFAQMMGTMDMAKESYDVKAGHWPEKYNECVLVLTENGSVSDFLLYILGLRDHAVLDEMVRAFMNEEEVVTEVNDNAVFTYSDFLNLKLKLVCSADYYQYDEEFGVWIDKSDDDEYVKGLIENGENLVISGIVQPKNGATSAMLNSGGIYYTPDLTKHLIEQAGETQIVKDQLAEPNTDVFNGKLFTEEDEKSSDFDMSNLFKVNTGALQAAFKFDESKMKLDLSDLDVNFDSSSLPQPNIDFSQMGSQMPGDSGGDSGSGGGSSNGGSNGENADMDMSGMQINQEVAAKMVSDLMADFQNQLTTLPGTTMPEKVQAYMASDSAKVIISDAMANGLIDTSAMQQQQLEQQAAMQEYLNNYMTQYMTEVMSALSAQMRTAMTTAMTRAMNQLSEGMSQAMSIDAEAFKDAFEFNMTDEELTELITSMMSGTEASFDNNLAKLNYAQIDNPYEIDIFAKDFEAKQGIIDILDSYNDRMNESGQESKAITYTDIVGALMSSVTTIIDMISYVLIAFVSISLIVSSIMIGVITYISVLERKKEIGILRAIGASKGNISQVFNAETVIEGLIAGVLGVGITALCCIPISALVYTLFDVPNVASLPWQAAFILVIISVALTFIAGLIPASSASRKDPVEALRSE
ncbi:ABC transporter ATP-binding protein/permease [Adlercreutzia sp. ZJ304]|uniref:ABC transporter ATP-binding protein/permease n=1 Tax=Adlercreutzia sp. ZJ304 TaxID=2709791 RepID=UPI0013ED2525|nr:ABC transporter ATP-binding protein/permease [Adlercreutzia sp. ZJ304]